MIWKNFLLCFFTVIIHGSRTPEDEEISVWVFTGGRADLPCQPNPKIENDQPQLVLWYKSSYTLPIYSYDVRVGEFTSGVRWADEKAFGGRAYFSPLSETPSLVLEPVHQYDEGLYTCRVDYQMSPSTTTVVNLTVVIPPGPPMIIWGGRAVVGVVGPLREDQTTEMVCRSIGGRPLPKVTWWHHGRRLPLLSVNSTSDPGTGTYAVEARLSISATRDLQGAHLTCHTQTPIDENTHKPTLYQPRTVSVTLNITLSPMEVRILSPDEVVSPEGSTVSLVCRAIGSHPPAELIWWRGPTPLTPHTTYAIEDGGNITMATLTLTVSRIDDGSQLSCSGTNPALPQQPQTDTAKIVVHYIPVVGLSLGRALNPRTIKEGDDVYFECDVQANPRFHRIDWYHNGMELMHNMSAGVVMSGSSLVLRNLLRRYSGTYTCAAANIEGRTTSNAVHLTVKHSPVCAGSSHMKTLGAAKGSPTALKCTVEAEPSDDVSWRWTKLPNEDSQEEEDEVVGEFMRNDGLNSVLQFTPQEADDYGTFHCYATNSIGRQRVACAVHLVPAGPPDTPSNCSASPIEYEDNNIIVEASLAITCSEGFNGGLPQHFQLEAWQDGTVVANLTSQFPEWVVKDVRSGTGVTLNIAAHNARGSSDPIAMEVQTTNAQGRAAPGVELPLELPVLLGAVAGVIGVLLLFLIVSLLLARRVKKPKPQKPLEDVALTPTIADSFDPDVVQSIYRHRPSLDVLPSVTGGEDSEEEILKNTRGNEGEGTEEDVETHNISQRETSAFVHSCSDSLGKSPSQMAGDIRGESLQSRSCSSQQLYDQDLGAGGSTWHRQEASNFECPSDDSGVSESESDSELRELVSERRVATLYQNGDGRTYIAVPNRKSQYGTTSSVELHHPEASSSSSSATSSNRRKNHRFPSDNTEMTGLRTREKSQLKSSEELRLLPSSQREMRLVQITGDLRRLPVSTQDLRDVQSPVTSPLEIICLAVSPETSLVDFSSEKHEGKSHTKSQGLDKILNPATSSERPGTCQGKLNNSENMKTGVSKTETKLDKTKLKKEAKVNNEGSKKEKDKKSSQKKGGKGKLVPTTIVPTSPSPSSMTEMDLEKFKLAHMKSKESSV